MSYMSAASILKRLAIVDNPRYIYHATILLLPKLQNQANDAEELVPLRNVVGT